MRRFYPWRVEDTGRFKRRLLGLSRRFAHACILESNNYPNYPYTTFGNLIALDAIAVLRADQGALPALENFRQQHPDWLFGCMAYDLKNEIESGLVSEHPDGIGAPLLSFFVPRFLVKIEHDRVELGVVHPDDLEAFRLLLETADTELPRPAGPNELTLAARFSREEYEAVVSQLRRHILRGDIYEINFCQEWFAENATIDPVSVFERLNTLSKAPFTSFFRDGDTYLMCASPERFLKRQRNKLISQPIKGTRKRSKDPDADARLKAELLAEEKERSENVMIVDLVRNDLARVADTHSVQVEELFGVYTFEQVHQMISTVTASVPGAASFSDIIRAVFPMGSMTGAPKVSAMQLIERYERTRRGWYSGTVGYITPKGNFDFNVVIRSILYDERTRYVSVQAGSAITYDCDAAAEYDECRLKAKAMLQALQGL